MLLKVHMQTNKWYSSNPCILHALISIASRDTHVSLLLCLTSLTCTRSVIIVECRTIWTDARAWGTGTDIWLIWDANMAASTIVYAACIRICGIQRWIGTQLWKSPWPLYNQWDSYLYDMIWDAYLFTLLIILPPTSNSSSGSNADGTSHSSHTKSSIDHSRFTTIVFITGVYIRRLNLRPEQGVVQYGKREWMRRAPKR